MKHDNELIQRENIFSERMWQWKQQTMITDGMQVAQDTSLPKSYIIIISVMLLQASVLLDLVKMTKTHTIVNVCNKRGNKSKLIPTISKMEI